MKKLFLSLLFLQGTSGYIRGADQDITIEADQAIATRLRSKFTKQNKQLTEDTQTLKHAIVALEIIKKTNGRSIKEAKELDRKSVV